MSINWFPGHMHKATKEIKEILPKVDLIIEVLDARIPYSSENPVIATLRGDKPCIKLLSKSDLADPELTRQWLEYFEKEQGVKAMAVTTEQPERIRALTDLCKKLVPKKVDAIGGIHALIMGIPNVGKSTIINTLAGRMIAKTGNEPAITKGQQRINLRNGIVLLDTPGILWAKVENEKSGYRLATTGAIKDTAMSYDDVGFFAADYLIKTYPELLKKRYQLEKLPQTELEFFETIGQQRGCLGAGGRVDFDKVCRLFLGEFRDATLGRITLETPKMAEKEKVAVQVKMETLEAQKTEKKSQRKKKRKRR